MVAIRFLKPEVDLSQPWIEQGSYGQGKSGKTERVTEKSGNFKIPPTRPIIYALFSHFRRLLGASPPRSPQNPTGALPQTLQVSLYCNICLEKSGKSQGK